MSGLEIQNNNNYKIYKKVSDRPDVDVEFILVSEFIIPMLPSPLKLPKFPKLFIMFVDGGWFKNPTSVSIFDKFVVGRGEVVAVGLSILARVESVWETGVSVLLPEVVSPFTVMFNPETICSFKESCPRHKKNN